MRKRSTKQEDGSNKREKNKHIELAQKKVNNDAIKKERNLHAFVNEFESRGIPLRSNGTFYNLNNDTNPESLLVTESDEEFLAYCNNEMDVVVDEATAAEPPKSAFSLIQSMVLNKNVSLVYTSAKAIADLDYTYLHDSMPLPVQHLQPDPLVKLWPHQEDALKFFSSRESDNEQVGGCGLLVADEMGLGKTLQTLTHILRENQRLQRETGRRFNGPTLIVTPKIVIETWQREIEKSFPPGTFHYVTLTGDRQTPPDLVHIGNCVDIVFTTFPVIAVVYKALMDGIAVVPVNDTTTVLPGDISMDVIEESGNVVIEVIEDEEEEDNDGDDEYVGEEAENRDKRAKKTAEEAVREVVLEQIHRYQLLFQKMWRRVVFDEAHILASRAELSFNAASALKALSKWLLTGTPIQNAEDNIYACLELMCIPTENVVGVGLVLLKALLDKVKIRRLKSDIKSLSFDFQVDRKIEYIDFASQVERMLYLFFAEHAKSMINRDKKKKKQKKKTTEAAVEKNDNITSYILKLRQVCMDFRIIQNLILPNGMLLLSDTPHRNSLKNVSFSQKLTYEDSCQPYVHVPNSGNEELERKAYALNRATTVEYIPAGEKQPSVQVRWDPFERDAFVERTEFTQALYETIHAIMCQEEENTHAPVLKHQVVSRIFATMGFDSIDSIVDAVNQGDEEVSSLLSQIDQIYRCLKSRCLPPIATKPAWILRYIREEMIDPTDKLTVFSDSVQTLRQIAKYLDHAGIRYVLVTGESPKGGENTSRLRRFERDPTIRVALLSLKVCNIGLNLEFANHVIFVNIWWNPYAKDQAECRVLRPGQKKKVFIRSIIIRDTIEEYILKLCHYKKSLSRNLIENDDSFYDEAGLLQQQKESETDAVTLIGVENSEGNKEIRKHLFGYVINCIS